MSLPLKQPAAAPQQPPPPTPKLAPPSAASSKPAVTAGPPPLASRPCSHKHNSSNAKELKKLMGHDCGKKEMLPAPPRKSKSLSAVPNKV